jgi:hypothetical protein
MSTSDDMRLQDFIGYIKEQWNITPKAAMSMLNVKSLTTGINRREALEQLRRLVMQKEDEARRLVSRLRERKSVVIAREGRLRVLGNIMYSQMSESQLQDLTKGVWGVNSLKKLTVDQVEELISWGKEDNFLTEVDAVLALLKEEDDARSDG